MCMAMSDTKENFNSLNQREQIPGAPDRHLSLKEVCDLLSISIATAKNWIRLGKLIPEKNGTTFNSQYINTLCQQIRTGEDTRLKNRRNKKSITGRILYEDYIRDSHNQSVIENLLALNRSITEQELRILLANFAVQLYYQSYDIPFCGGNVLSEYLNAAPTDKLFYSLITDLLKGDVIDTDSGAALKNFLECTLSFLPEEDTLGFVYLSLRDLGQRKSAGAYYTPVKTVNALLENIYEDTDIAGKTFFDPCCGTGNFLIGLINKGVSVSSVYGQDIDEISIQITRINLLLLCHSVTEKEIYSHFTCNNTLMDTCADKFDIILGNPPWGFAFSEAETKYLVSRYLTAKTKGTESFDLFIEKGLSLLETNGILAFVLPESLLNVASHTKIRKLLIEKCSFRFVSYLGDAFAGVQCPAIILGVMLSKPGSTVGCRVSTGKDKFTILHRRTFEDSTLTFNISDEENECLNKISAIHNRVYLRNHAKFALGIVTGNNKKYIKKEMHAGYEIILKGSDIQRYRINPSNNYILFEPETFQQVAPVEMYRAPEKLLYRFISDVPIFAYDNARTLSLNSCNILIPQIEGLHIKYILAILNSSVAAFYLSKKYNSVKLLRSHLEQLPIAVIPFQEQEKIVKKVDRILQSKESIRGQYEELDNIIMQLYGLEPEHGKIIRAALRDRNSFPDGNDGIPLRTESESVILKVRN